MQDFQNLDVWRKAHRLTLDIYGATRKFPREEQYGLTAQIRRAAVSVPANIAEGCMRGSDAEFSRFLAIALGSASEVQYLLILAQDIGFLDAERSTLLLQQVVEVKRMLTTLKRKVKDKS